MHAWIGRRRRLLATILLGGTCLSSSFTVFGATPLRNPAVLGFSASTNIAAATSLCLRYDGEIATGTDLVRVLDLRATSHIEKGTVP